MDSRGMLLPRPCSRCGELLDDGAQGRPAELYAGTFTGLCYDCQRAPSFVQRAWGARSLSFPSHAPAWRRDRETYIAYPDCPDCAGKGHKMISRADAYGGPYPEYCRPCLDKHLAAKKVADDAQRLEKLEEMVYQFLETWDNPIEGWIEKDRAQAVQRLRQEYEATQKRA